MVAHTYTFPHLGHLAQRCLNEEEIHKTHEKPSDFRPFIGLPLTPLNLHETNSEFAPEKDGTGRSSNSFFLGPLGRSSGAMLLLVCREGKNHRGPTLQSCCFSVDSSTYTSRPRYVDHTFFYSFCTKKDQPRRLNWLS